MQASALLSQADYAKHRGCSAVAVHKAVKAGRISLVDGLIDPAVADSQWTQNTRARMNSNAHTLGAHPGSQSESGGNSPGEVVDYWTARAMRETSEAKMAGLKLAEMQRRLIPKDQATSAVYTAFRHLRDSLSALPRKAAPAMAIATDVREVEACLSDALRETLDLFASRTLPELLMRLGAYEGEVA